MAEQSEILALDAARALNEMKRDALGHLFPHPQEIRPRLPFITHLRGRRPNMYDLYAANVEWEGWLAIEEKRKIDWDRLNPIEFFKLHSPSIEGERSKQAVEIAKTEQPSSSGWSFSDLIRGKK